MFQQIAWNRARRQVGPDQGGDSAATNRLPCGTSPAPMLSDSAPRPCFAQLEL